MREWIIFALIVGGGLAWWFVFNRRRPARFRARQVVTGGGLEFLFLLRDALPECVVCPQIAATSLLEPLGTGAARKQALSRIVGRRVGYAVFDEEMQLLAVIELDHRPRLTRREAECDGYFLEAGIQTLRFDPRRMPSAAKIRAAVFPREGKGVHAAATSMRSRFDTIEFRSQGSWRNSTRAHI